MEAHTARLTVEDFRLRHTSGTTLLSVQTLYASEGEWIALRGPSGCGKSSFLEIIAGLRPKHDVDLEWSGSITANGMPVEHTLRRSGRLQSYRSGIAWLPQRPMLETGPVIETFRILATFRNSGFANADDVVTAAEPLLHELDLPRDVLSQHSATLSGGETTRVALARIMLLRRPLVLLDEPGAALDSARSRLAAAILRRELPESSVVLVGHDDRWDVAGVRDVAVGP